MWLIDIHMSAIIATPNKSILLSIRYIDMKGRIIKEILTKDFK